MTVKELLKQLEDFHLKSEIEVELSEEAIKTFSNLDEKYDWHASVTEVSFNTITKRVKFVIDVLND